MSAVHKAFDAGHQEGTLEERIALATERMSAAVGRLDWVPAAIERELTRKIGKAVFDQLARDGIPVQGLKVLDDGAGLGAVSAEAAERGAHVTALEPGRDSADICEDRLGKRGRTICADGERLPFTDSEFDLVVSIQVLEHVEHPLRYLEEAARVLRPGGHLYLSCENYLAFREPHYGVFWLPLMPKWLGRLYLKARGKPTDFLTHSVFYVTTPGVLRMLKRCGLTLVREVRVREKLTRRGLPGWLASWLVWLEYARKMFSVGTYVLAVKR